MFKFFKNNRHDKINTRFESLKEKVFININNQWVLDDKALARALFYLMEKLTDDQKNQLLQEGQIIFIPISGEYSCLVHQVPDANVILLFPELIKLLKSVDNDRGLSILAHEFGHIYHQHYQRNISILESQIEADDFAFRAGFGHGLIEVLLGYNDIDSQTRVSVLTSKILSKEKA